jgi:hypothetical protein
MSSNVSQDGSCARSLDDFSNSWKQRGSVAVPLWATMAACYFIGAAVVAYKIIQHRSSLREEPESFGPKFDLTRYLRLLFSGLLFCGLSQFFLVFPDTSFNPPSDADPNDITTRFLGNKHIVTWQLLYAVGNVQLVATQIFVLVRLLNFSAKHSAFAHRQSPRLQKILWVIWCIYCPVYVTSSAVLFFGTLLADIGTNLYATMQIIISVSRLLHYLALSILFAYGGRLSLALMGKSLSSLNHTLFAASGSRLSGVTNATKTRDLMSQLLFKLQLSTAWNVTWYLIVFLFYLLLALGLQIKKSDNWGALCDADQPALTRAVPFMIGPVPTFLMLMGSDVAASMLTLWAMLKPQPAPSAKRALAGSLA